MFEDLWGGLLGRAATTPAFVIIGGDHRYRGVSTAASTGPGKTGSKSA